MNVVRYHATYTGLGPHGNKCSQLARNHIRLFFLLPVPHGPLFLLREELGQELDNIEFKSLRNPDFRESILQDREGAQHCKVAVANGFRNIQNLVQKMKRKRCDYDYVEVRFDLIIEWITSSFPCLLPPTSSPAPAASSLPLPLSR